MTTITLPDPKPLDVGERKIIRRFAGYACEWSGIFPGGTFGNDFKKIYRFQPRCFDAAIASGREIVFSKDLNNVAYARLSDGTLRLKSDSIGLFASVDLLDTPENRELSRLIGNNKTRGWSFTALPSLFGQRIRRDGDVEIVELHHVGLTQVCIVVNKHPRAKTRVSPIFSTNERVYCV